MQTEDFHLFGLLEFRPDEGTIYCKDERMLVWTASAFGALQKQLIARLGIDEARKMMRQFGYCHGFHSYLTAEQLFGKKHEGSSIGPRFHEVMGFLKNVNTHVVEGVNPPSFRLETNYRGSMEVEQFLINFSKSKIPVCWWAVAFASGYCSAAFELEIYYKELRCAAQGDTVCDVVGRDAAQWGDEAATLRVDYGFASAEEAEKFRDQQFELHRQWHLRRQQAQGDRSGSARRSEEISLRERLTGWAEESGFIVREEAMWEALEHAVCVAKLNTPVLVHGETGTGKEFVVNLIHQQSARACRPLVSINCAALTETLLESELFGHVRGAFTGAVADKQGLFELADEGTLFLDEIGEMPLSIQAKLLRVLENGEIRRVGSTQITRVNLRILAATHRDLQTLAEKGQFRQDLYFRLNSFVIELPALRERRDSIPAMVQRFMREVSIDFDKRIDAVSPEVMSKLMAYNWPGNVRELKHAIERAVVVARGEVINVSDLPSEVVGVTKNDRAPGPDVKKRVDLKGGERQIIINTLAQHGGNRMATATALSISATTLWRKMRRYGLL